MIDVELASQLLNFGARIDSPIRAREQLDGAVALHNLLERHGVAYLADEVGMGKTLVALGVVALFRHFDPRFRVLVIAPRGNIQRKWEQEMRTFFAGENVRFPDLRVRGFGGVPARRMVSVDGLLSLLREVALDTERDFFVRLPSFSFQMGEEDEHWDRIRDQLRAHLPWLSAEALDLRGRRQRKDNLARALCCALPIFDLVIVDEAHNLKHGFSEKGAARNRVLGVAFGHPDSGTNLRLFPNYGVRARRVLMVSATPIEETYRHLWNQLNVFGLGAKFPELNDPEVTDEAKQRVARRFLIRRVTEIRTAGADLTKNQYRREWRRGGVTEHDQPTRIEDDRQRLTFALVQKKVSELLGSKRFNNSFQIGMLASFESFLETAKLKRTDEQEPSNFDDAEQSDRADEREGIDVHDLNRLGRSHRERFKREMPHPKMDALVTDLMRAWHSGRKALVFVRRVASVKELRAKLEDCYDDWLRERLRTELTATVRERFEQVWLRYRSESIDARNEGRADEGNTFYSWFFHGSGPSKVLSGANIQRRFTQAGAIYSTFFEDNHAADLLDVRPGQVTATMAARLSRPEMELRKDLRLRSTRFLGRAQRVARGDRFHAAQGAAVSLLQETPGPWQVRAQAVWALRFRDHNRLRAAETPEIGDFLELPTFFTELRLRPALRDALWPGVTGTEPAVVLREEALRAQILATAARLGHAFLDFYILTINRIGSLDQRAQESDDGGDAGRGMIDAYLDLLESQRTTPVVTRGWRAFDELSELARNHRLIVDVNAPELPKTPFEGIPRRLGELLGEQHPVGGMSGEVNQRLLRQFRMPGYPLVLLTTDILQEGEDLHTFCSSVYHYGISWTPSAMEQRIGRIDRVRSQTERRLSGCELEAGGDDLLQVYFPHLEDSVEVLQVRRVLERMNQFLRLMHKGLGTGGAGARQLDVAYELAGDLPPIERITERLESAFTIDPKLLRGTRRTLAVQPSFAEEAIGRLAGLVAVTVLEDGKAVEWDPDAQPGSLFGVVRLGTRQQPFGLFLRAFADRLVVRCISPIGRVSPAESPEEVKMAARQLGACVGAIALLADRSYDLTIEEDVLLGAKSADTARIQALVERVVRHADQFELRLLGGDRPLSQFKADLLDEGRRSHRE